MYTALINHWKMEDGGSSFLSDSTSKMRGNVPARLVVWALDWADPNGLIEIAIQDEPMVPRAVEKRRFQAQLDHPELIEINTGAVGTVRLSTGAILWPSPGLGGVVTACVDTFDFTTAQNSEAGLALADDYVRWLKKNRGEVRLSLWVEESGNPKRFHHVLLFDSIFGPEHCDHWIGTIRYEYATNPYIDAASIQHRPADVLWCSGGMIERVRLSEAARLVAVGDRGV